jgi:hypothetical protein
MIENKRLGVVRRKSGEGKLIISFSSSLRPRVITYVHGPIYTIEERDSDRARRDE